MRRCRKCREVIERPHRQPAGGSDKESDLRQIKIHAVLFIHVTGGIQIE